jgi:hypothetical protein
MEDASTGAEEAARDSGADPIQVAYERGQQWQKLGHRRTVPGEYRDPKNDDLAQAWYRGYDGALL